MNRRVVITGCGVVSPVGSNVDTFWESLVNGKCGIDLIKKFDTTDLKVKVAGEVLDFDPLDYIKKNEVRKTDIFTQYALGAAIQAMEDSGIQDHVDPTRLGVYMGLSLIHISEPTRRTP